MPRSPERRSESVLSRSLCRTLCRLSGPTCCPTRLPTCVGLCVPLVPLLSEVGAIGGPLKVERSLCHVHPLRVLLPDAPCAVVYVYYRPRATRSE